MRYLILSDIHSNVEALSAVLREAAPLSIDRIYCLGDFVGYHADPNPCVEWARQNQVRAVAGNHDRAASGRKAAHEFPPRARQAIRFTRGALTDENRKFLRRLPTWELSAGGFVAVHAALHPEPNCDLHLTRPERISASLSALSSGRFGSDICFFGHTHRACVYEWTCGRVVERHAARVRLTSGAFYLVNPGSVGQSRDGDPRAGFAVYDTVDRMVQFYRVGYDVELCQNKARAAGLFDREPLALAAGARVADTMAEGARMVRAAARRCGAVVTRAGERVAK